jgi:ribosomal protein L11 methyltransferase
VVIRLAVRVRRGDAERVLAELLDLAPDGLEERDLGDAVEYALYGAAGELPELGELRAAAGGALVDVSSREVADDWAERWREFHRPLVLGDRLVVRPPWISPDSAAPAALDVVIEPGQAFGTGAHATTRLCLELLLDLEPGDGLLDLGCGSGVLAITAARIGWRGVRAVDHDPSAVEATRLNAAANGVELVVQRVDLRTDPLPSAPTVLANLVRPLLLAYAQRLARPPATLIAGGLLAGEEDEIAAAVARHGLAERARVRRGEWAAVQFMLNSHAGPADHLA